MKTVLVTGGVGYIGSHTCVELLEQGFEVVVVDNLSNSKKSVLERIEQITGKKLTFVYADLRDEESLDKIFQNNKIDAVIHFAGWKAVGESVEKPLEYYDNNVNGTITLLKSMQKHGCKEIIFSSSATVYGDPERLPIDEECRLQTTNPYGETKLVIENMLKNLCQADAEWKAVILRYFNPIGAHESGLIGDDPLGAANNLLPAIAKVANGESEFVKIYGGDYDTPDGTGVRDYIHVVDLAEAHILAMKNLKKTGFHVFNLGAGKGYSVLEILHAFENACGKKLSYKILERRGGDISTCFSNCEKAKKELGWQAKHSLSQMCESFWKFQKTKKL